MKCSKYYLYVMTIFMVQALTCASHQQNTSSQDVAYPDNFTVRFNLHTSSALVSHNKRIVHIGYYDSNSEAVRYKDYMFTIRGHLIQCRPNSDHPVRTSYFIDGGYVIRFNHDQDESD